MRRSIYGLSLAFGATLAAACSGGGGAPPPAMQATPAAAATPSAGFASVRILIHVPAKTSSAVARRPQYVSPSTRSVVVTVQGTPTEIDLTTAPPSPTCTASAGGGTDCTLAVEAPPSTPGGTGDTFAVTSYDETGGAGNALSSGSTSAPIVVNTANTVTLTLTGIVASASISYPPVPTCTATSGVPVTINALDADGNTIGGTLPYDRTIKLAYSDATGNSTFTGTSVSKPGDGATISYNGNYEPGGTLTMSATGIPNVTATFFPTPTVCAEYGVNPAGRPAIGLEYIRLGSDGDMHYTEQFANAVGSITATPLSANTGKTGVGLAGANTPVVSQQVSTNLPVPTDILPVGTNLWIGDEANGLETFPTTLGPADSTGYGLGTYRTDALALGPDGNIWFTDSQDGVVNSITPAGVFGAAVSLPDIQGGSRNGIAAGTDGALWVGDAAGEIARVPTNRSAVTYYQIPGVVDSNDKPSATRIASDGAGNLWFTEDTESNIGEVSQSTGVVKIFPLPSANAISFDICKGADGAMYFTEETTAGDRIGRIDAAGAITEAPVITAGLTGIFGIGAGPAATNDIWFTETLNDAEKVGYLTI